MGFISKTKDYLSNVLQRRDERRPLQSTLIEELKGVGISVKTSGERDHRFKSISDDVLTIYRDIYSAKMGIEKFTFFEKRRILDSVYHIINDVSVPYGRSMQNPEYCLRVLYFNHLFWHYRDKRWATDDLLESAWNIICYSWSIEDMKQIPPFVIQSPIAGSPPMPATGEEY